MRCARTLLLALSAFAMVGGASVQLALSVPLVPSVVTAEMPCDMAAMPMAETGQGQTTAPCKGLTPDCIKQMGCIADVALPVRLAAADPGVPFGTADLRQVRSTLSGTVSNPDPMPPRTT